MNMKSRIRNMKISNKLMLSYLVACVIPVLVVSSVIYNFSARSLEEASLEFAQIFNSQIVTSIDNFIEDYDKVTKSALMDNEVIAHLNKQNQTSVNEEINSQIDIKKMMLRIMTLKPDIKGIMLLTANDKLYQYSNSAYNVNAPLLREQDWIQNILDAIDAEDKLFVTAVHDASYYDTHKDRLVITVGRILLDYSGAYVGVLLIDLDSASLFELNDDFLLARNNYNIKINVTDSEGGIIYDSDVASGRMTWEEALDSTKASLNAKNQADFIIMTNETKRCNILVNATIPRSDLLMKIEKVNYVTIVAVLICVIAVLLTSMLLSRMITKPIKRLQSSMKFVVEGDYTQLLEENAQDEIGGLIKSYNHMIIEIKRLIEDVYIAEIKQKNAKYLALQMQINPHMLYNSLESIRMKALVSGNEEVAFMIKTLSYMFKIALDRKTTPNLIKDEIEYMKHYIKLQNVRFGDIFQLEINLNEEIMNSSIIALVFQPLIENSLEHGYKGHQTILEISINGETTCNDDKNSDIFIRIKDNGSGMNSEKVREVNQWIHSAGEGMTDILDDKKESIGLRNIAERIKLHYGKQYYLRIASSDENGTMVEIKIPKT